MTEKNLFLYDLAVVAIFKDESKYLKEWLDYHLLAGVGHFYLYNNDSSDDYEEVLAPYVAANLVTLINFPGRAMQMPAYDDAIRRYRFFCRYMALIDIDEFIFPKSNQSISEVVDEILLKNSKAAGLAINWHVFGSNGQRTADYSRGVLERFTRCAPNDWQGETSENNIWKISNAFVKLIIDPRKVAVMAGPHVALYFGEEITVDERGKKVDTYVNCEIPANKLVINHYYIKSLEEFEEKKKRGYACFYDENKLRRTLRLFELCDRNEVFDDEILKYRADRTKNFSLESDAEKFHRAEKFLAETLMQRSPFKVPDKFFIGKLETFLTCRAVAEKLDAKIGNRAAEEYALVWIYQTLVQENLLTYGEVQQFMRALPDILARPYPICRNINELTRNKIMPIIYEVLKSTEQWGLFAEMRWLNQFLKIV